VDTATSADPFYLQAYIEPIAPTLATFSIGNGAAMAVTARVTLDFTSTGGLPTEYQVSESSDFTGASWTAMPGTAPVIELSSGNGAKTLYFKIRNTIGESAVLSDNITRASLTSTGPVIFTQYYEGTSNNKYIEITNTSASIVDLSTWTLVRWGNAEAENWKVSNVPSGSSSGVLNLSGTLAAGQTVVLSNNQAASPVAAGSAFISSSIINHTGNDSFGLYQGTVATENLRDALSFTNAGNEGAENSFVRISAGTGFDFTAGTNITGFNTVWQPVTLAVVNAATSNQKEFLGTYLDSVVQDYAAWIGTFYNGVSDPLVIGFNADPDLDGVPNGVEALTGGIPNSPGVFATTELTKTGNTFTFVYPKARVIPFGVTASYEWSTDLLNWYTTGQSNGVNTVTLAEDVYTDDNVSPLIDYQVTATVTAGTATKLFVRVLAEN
ncbi:MAG: lamin tail domain-containing protein, partial [Luteolibacter sp.]